MRKKEREITNPDQIDMLLKRARVMRLAMCGPDGWPYLIPLNFGYEGGDLYFHTGYKGKKIELLEQNDKVCFEVDLDVEIRPADEPCKWGCRYQSVVGYARAQMVEGDEKIKGLNAVMLKYAGKEFEYPEKMLAATCVIKLNIESMTGKRVMPDLTQ
jgi:nitroimidazol reductase NimA-like FMN-containing flavoprotein (pyridoxamine 5'-phosphate oxidase superfamily)